MVRSRVRYIGKALFASNPAIASGLTWLQLAIAGYPPTDDTLLNLLIGIGERL